MASAGGDAGGGGPTDAGADRAKPDRRAEALRANLKRRKAQTRARGEARPDEPPAADAPGRDG